LRSRQNFSALRWVSIILIFLAVIVTVFQLVSYSRQRVSFPPGMIIAGVPVGGLDRQQTAERLVQAYGLPIELRYGTSTIQIKPGVVGFELDLESMLSAADLQRMNQPFWIAFWDYLWNRLPVPVEVPLSSKLTEDRLRGFLKDEIAARYDLPPSAAAPVAGSTNFQSGSEGSVLDIDRAVVLIGDALKSPSARVVNLSVSKVEPPRPSLQNLQILLQQIISVAGFDGLVEIYIQDLQTAQGVHFATQGGAAVTPDVAFTAASTVKIPIMVSAFKRLKEPTSTEATDLIGLMIDRSENPPADQLMMDYLDPVSGPLLVTQDMQTIGLQNTFLAGYFYQGAPLLKSFTTPANSRTDIFTNPDSYNQTTPAELGMLLEDIYQCANTGGGTFAAAFPGEVTQNECRQMIAFLVRNKIGVLIEAGLPDGTQFAHKHGWITDPADGVIHTIGDAGIVYSPAGNYILSIYLYHPVQVVFDPVNVMVSQLSRAVYNYFNLSAGN
jgi:beta-lactamase class A